MQIHFYINATAAAILCCFLLASSPASGTSIQKIGFQELVSQAELVFEGEVISSVSKRHPETGRIYTYVNFIVSEVVKGQFDKEELMLRFSGGQIGDEGLLYESLVYPETGEQGVYFVSTIKRPMVNPLVGWSQGHFMHQNGQMMTNTKQPIISIEPAFQKTTGELSEGSIGGMQVATKGENGMSVSQFKRYIKDALR